MALSIDRRYEVDTARAFDGVAAEYDRTNAANPILRHMRTRALTCLRRHVGPGATVLDIGCGPGTDLPALLLAGYAVTAIDVSPGMVAHARRKAALLGGGRSEVLCRSIGELDRFADGAFDASFSNFGPLNCAADLPATAGEIRRVLRPDGLLVASVIGRICPWEIALFLSRGDLRRATIRFGRQQVGVPLKDGTVWTRYYLPAAFVQAFTDQGFRLCHLEALGSLAPPPYLEAFARRRPGLVNRLASIDRAIATWPIVRNIGDHFLVVLQRD